MKKMLIFCLLTIAPPVLAGVGNTSLHKAVLSGDWQRTLKLLEDGADANVKNKRGETPMMVAAKLPARGALITTVDILLEKGGDLTTTDNKGRTAIRIAKHRAPGWLPFLRWHAYYFRKEGKLAKDAVVE